VTSPPNRRQQLQTALDSGDPLGAVDAFIDEGTPLGLTFKWAFACILETNSAELPILFDRYDDTQLRAVEDALEAIGAARTLEDYRTLKRAFDAALASGLDRPDASDAIAKRPELSALGRRYKDHAAEMEERLIAFCRAHVDEL
jgi:hypothetical protein